MGDISIKGRSKLLGGGRVGFKSGGRVGLKAGGRTGFKSGTGDAKVAETEAKASRKMKTEVAEAAKKKRDKLQAQHIPPGGGGRELPGPHKIDYNRRDLEPLLRWLPKKTKEKTLAFANKMDEKMAEHYKKKRTKEKMQKRAKKLTAYEGIT